LKLEKSDAYFDEHGRKVTKADEIGIILRPVVPSSVCRTIDQNITACFFELKSRSSGKF
jgi:hypothetical protein